MSPRKSSVHSSIGASSAHRWFACPGSVALSKTAPAAPQSEYAAEGTAAHSLGETCLVKGEDAERYLGKQFLGFEVTEEMAEAVQLYLDTIRHDMYELKGNDGRFEQKFDLSKVFPGLYGTNDAAIFVPFGKLIIYDYKHGAGIPVDIVDNKQLLYYALGALMNLPSGDYEPIELVIVQPRASHRDGPVRRWQIDQQYILDFAVELKKAAEATTKPDAKVVPGDHCRWCRALPICKAVKNKVFEMAVADFPDDADAKSVELIPAGNLSPEQVTKALGLAGMIDDWIRSVQSFAFERAKQGIAIPGYKLVKKKANRKWIDEEEVKTLFSKEEIWNKKLKSPAQMEKTLGKAKRDQVDLLCETPDTGLTLAADTDKREAVVPQITEDFTD